MRRIIAGFLVAAATVFAGAGAAYAESGYRGDKVNGCQAYIQGTAAWTNCTSTTKAGQLATKAWCTAQPTRSGSWVMVSNGATKYDLSTTGCHFNVHTAQTLWQ